jgi:hypothetical protein
MVNYEGYAKNKVFSSPEPAITLAGRLQTFKVNQFTQLYQNFLLAKREGKITPLAAMLGVQLAVGGMYGMYLMDVAELIWDVLKAADRQDGEPDPIIQDFSPKEWTMTHLPDSIAFGPLSAWTGLGLTNSFTANLVGGAQISDLLPVYTGIGNLITEAPKAFSDNEITRMGFFKRQGPAALQGTLDIVDDQKRAISPTTGLPVYQYKEGEFKNFSNIFPFGRMKAAAQEKAFLDFKKDQQASQQALSKSIKKDVSAALLNKMYSKEGLSRKIESYITEFGGTPESISRIIEQHAKDMQISDARTRAFLQQIGLANIKEVQKAMELSQ